MAKKFDLAIMIGRFQPLHKGHIKMFEAAAKASDHILVLFGSAKRAPDLKNPLSGQARTDMICDAVAQEDLPQANYEFGYLVDDLYDNEAWKRQVKNRVREVLEARGLEVEKARVAIIGHKKADVIYLDWFPAFRLIEIENYQNINATNIRDFIYKRINGDFNITGPIAARYLMSVLPPSTIKFIERNFATFELRAQEAAFIEKYQAPFKDLPYPPVFVTVDAVVVCRGHILLIKRKAIPGKGLYALPGGFLDPDETHEVAITRELYEETGVQVDPEDINFIKVFSHPKRSQRGRTVTICGFIHIKGNMDEFPKTKIMEGIHSEGEIERIVWVPFDVFFGMSDQMFEDHHSIGKQMIRIGY